MKPVISPVQDAVLQKNFKNIQQCLDGGVSLDNMNILVIEGTTASVPDTQTKVAHSMVPRPVAWQMLVGDVYVQEIANEFIDVRSTKPGVNFKIVLFGGTPVTGEQLVEIGSSQYLPTTEYITNNAPQITIQNIVDAGVTVLPVQIESSSNVGPSSAAVAVASIGNFIADANYIYFTNVSGATDTLFRYSRTSGVIDSIANGAARAMAAMFSDGTNLWVASATTAGGTTQVVYQFDIATFTLTATHTGTSSSNTDSINDLYVDGSNIYTNGGNGTGTTAWLTKWARGGGAVSHLNLNGTGGTANKARQIMPTSDGAKLYVLVDDSSIATIKIIEVTLSSYTVTATITSASRKWRVNCGVLVSDAAIVFPVSVDTSKTGTIAYGITAGVVVYDLVGAAFTEYPVANIAPGAGANGAFITNIAYSNGFAYIVNSAADGSTNHGTTLIRLDSVTQTPEFFWFPWFPTSSPSNANVIRSILMLDTDGLPMIYRQTGSTAANFDWFKPDLSVFDA